MDLEKSHMTTELAEALFSAMTFCDHPTEEEGGVIFEKEGDYEFVKVKNEYAGEPVARGLYQADLAQFGKEVIGKLDDGWKIHGSFHTHPSFSPVPSQLDKTVLFKGYKYNYILATRDASLSCSVWGDDKELTTRYTNEKALIGYLQTEYAKDYDESMYNQFELHI